MLFFQYLPLHMLQQRCMPIESPYQNACLPAGGGPSNRARFLANMPIILDPPAREGGFFRLEVDLFIRPDQSRIEFFFRRALLIPTASALGDCVCPRCLSGMNVWSFSTNFTKGDIFSFLTLSESFLAPVFSPY